MMVPLAEYKLDSFYQDNGKTKHVRDFVEANIFPTVLEGTDMIAFRVDTVATYRYKKVARTRHRVEWGCVVGVNYPTNKKMQTGFVKMVRPGLDDQNTIIHLAEFGLHGFYQGNGKAKRIRGLLMTRGLPPLNGTSNGTQILPAGAFRVDFFGKVSCRLVCHVVKYANESKNPHMVSILWYAAGC
nr:protein NDR1-like [Tanacetum cinerariifolium]